MYSQKRKKRSWELGSYKLVEPVPDWSRSEKLFSKTVCWRKDFSVVLIKYWGILLCAGEEPALPECGPLAGSRSWGPKGSPAVGSEISRILRDTSCLSLKCGALWLRSWSGWGLRCHRCAELTVKYSGAPRGCWARWGSSCGNPQETCNDGHFSVLFLKQHCAIWTED